ncbi:MAG: haloacid dehalogenase [Phycisphaerae bacterium]|nr:MAG: haloacid dehalogenase [Phycisphaerae bacterium]
MLVLFDIDLTLITTRGCGQRAMVAAGRSLFGSRFTADGIDFAGRLDPLIISDLFANAGVTQSRDALARFRTAYAATLRDHLRDAPGVTALAGVFDLLTLLRSADASGPRWTMGLLTGNFEETGAIKLRACGIDPAWFGVRVWGDESPNVPPKRSDLVPVAMDRYRRDVRRDIDGRRVVVIGDTPHDIQAAKSHGCLAVGVATGRSSIDDLQRAGADLAIPDLRDTEAVLAFLSGAAAG